MNARRVHYPWLRLLVVLLALLPLAVLFLLPGTGPMVGLLWFWLVLLLCVWVTWFLVGGPVEDEHVAATAPLVGLADPQPRQIPPDQQPEPVREVMNVAFAAEGAGVKVFRGPLREPAASAVEKLKAVFLPQSVPMMQDEQLGAAVLLVPRSDSPPANGAVT